MLIIRLMSHLCPNPSAKTSQVLMRERPKKRGLCKQVLMSKVNQDKEPHPRLD